VAEKVSAVALADCGFDGAYFNRSAGAPPGAVDVALAEGDDCAASYGLSASETLAALPCGASNPRAGGYVLKFCDGETPPGWTGYAPIDD
jgi:hypothetical protein